MKRGPKPDLNSFRNNSVKKGFFIKNEIWNAVEKYSQKQNLSKSYMINEALQLYLLDSFKKGDVVNSDKHWDVVSLFSGCGGMDLGFEGDFLYFGRHYQKHIATSREKTFKIVFANDIFHEACEQYKSYFCGIRKCDTYVHEGDISLFLDEISFMDMETRSKFFPQSCDVVIGGFPCQDFSVAGKRMGFENERGRLYLQMKRVVEMLNPKIFIAENVKGLTNLGSALELIKRDFSKTGKHGYNIEHKLHMAADFGVPQTRERVFIRGIRNDLDPSCFNFPMETHSADSETGLTPWMTAEDAIGEIPDNLPNQNQFSRAKNYGAHCQGNKAIKKDYPSPTIRAEHHGNIEFHYEEKRRLSVRECARIQSFPDDFIFNCSPSKAYKLIGNAVPPVLAWHIADSVFNALSKWEGLTFINKCIQTNQISKTA